MNNTHLTFSNIPLKKPRSISDPLSQMEFCNKTILDRENSNNPVTTNGLDYTTGGFEGNGISQSNSRRASKISLDSARDLKKNGGCNCKNSQCLKLYCECFASMLYCDPKVCCCKNCMNNTSYDTTRTEAIKTYLVKSPNSFKKIPNITNMTEGSMTTNQFNTNRGCSCKKSFCLKKYCECYQSGIKCNSNCKCIECKNLSEHDQKSSSYYNKSNYRPRLLSTDFCPNSVLTVQRLEFKKVLIVPYKIIIDNYNMNEGYEVDN